MDRPMPASGRLAGTAETDPMQDSQGRELEPHLRLLDGESGRELALRSPTVAAIPPASSRGLSAKALYSTGNNVIVARTDEKIHSGQDGCRCRYISRPPAPVVMSLRTLRCSSLFLLLQSSILDFHHKSDLRWLNEDSLAETSTTWSYRAVGACPAGRASIARPPGPASRPG